MSAVAGVAQSGTGSEETPLQLDVYHVAAIQLGNYAELNSSAGSKIPTSLVDLPTSVELLNRNFINDVKAVSIGDLYPYVTGLTRESPLATGYTMRGVSASSSLFSEQVDGLPGLDTRFITPSTSAVERVEVIKGPNSVIYGQITPGGIINVVTKSPEAKAHTSLFATMSTYDGYDSALGADKTYTVSADTTGPITRNGRILYRLIAEVDRSESFRDNYQEKNFFINPQLAYVWNSTNFLRVKFNFSKINRNHDGGLVAPFNNAANLAPFNTNYQEAISKNPEQTESAMAEFQHALGSRWTLHVAGRTLYHTDGRHALNNNAVVSTQPVANSTMTRRLQHTLNFRRYNFIDANAYGDFTTGALEHTLLLGAMTGIDWNEIQNLSLGPAIAATNVYQPVLNVPFPADQPSTGNVRRMSTYNYDAYVSDQIRIGSMWRISLGLRYDQQSADSNNLTTHKYVRQVVNSTIPRVAVMLTPKDNISVYASYSESFDPNSVTNVDANGNNGFPPRQGKQIEIGAKASLLKNKVNFSLAGYSIKLENVSESTGVLTPAGDTIFRLDGRQDFSGVEFTGSYFPTSHWQLRAGLAYMPTAKIAQSITASNVGIRLANDPDWSGNFWTRYNIAHGRLKGLGFGLGATYQGDRFGGNPGTYLTMPAYFRCDASIYYELPRFSIALSAANVLDRKYIESTQTPTAIYPGAPRKLTLSIRTTF